MNRRYFYMVGREIAGWCAAAAVVLLALRAFIPTAREAYARRQFVKTLRATQNSAENCRICGKWDPPPVGLLCINSGDTYSLDLFDGGNQRDDGIYGYVHFSNGGDRLTGLRFEIKKVPDEKWGKVTLWAGNGYLDAGEMKTLYCDSCIEKLLEAMEGSEISGLVVVRGQIYIRYAKGAYGRILIRSWPGLAGRTGQWRSAVARPVKVMARPSVRMRK